MAEVTAKPVTAPISIIPSTPRLRTPDFSTTSSPSAASRIGVDAADHRHRDRDEHAALITPPPSAAGAPRSR